MYPIVATNALIVNTKAQRYAEQPLTCDFVMERVTGLNPCLELGDLLSTCSAVALSRWQATELLRTSPPWSMRYRVYLIRRGVHGGSDKNAARCPCGGKIISSGRGGISQLMRRFALVAVSVGFLLGTVNTASALPARLPVADARATGDIQIFAEYVVYAIRTTHQRSGHQVDIIGHS